MCKALLFYKRIYQIPEINKKNNYTDKFKFYIYKIGTLVMHGL